MNIIDCKEDPGWKYLRQSHNKNTIKNFDIKNNVWIPDAEQGFIRAKIKTIKDEQFIVITLDGNEKTIKKDETQQINPPKYEMIENMADLAFLNEASVLYNLRQRYYSEMIYTYSGLFCVVINPYKKLPIYLENICQMYIGKRRNEMPPHIFAVCDEAYQNMVQEQKNQSILITGESGAGKTENSKNVISYFAIVGSRNAFLLSSKKNKECKITSLKDQIIHTNPVLEAFGNAKTVRNNNSSRFGKYIRIHFNVTGKLARADIEHYLLEKSRVIKQAHGERSYHIFYQIMSGEIKGLRTKLFLERDIRHYRFVSQAEITIEGINDKEKMAITDKSFDIMKFTSSEKFELFGLTAAIMHMGELKFKQKPREETVECEDQKEGELACRLFKVEVSKFMNALLKPQVKVGSEWVNKSQNLEQVIFSIGALAKAIYSRMFHWIIQRCNATLNAKDLNSQFCIGVLDIAGFEIFDLNSFEQLWINYVNERLQQFFNHHIFILEQEEYKREAIKWEFIDFGLDSKECIELIEKPLGIISMLDEECIVPKATDLTLSQKLNYQHLGKHPNFQRPKALCGKQEEAQFAVVHYAGTVSYNLKFWLEKNKDPLNDSVVAILKDNEGHALLNEIWNDYQTQHEIMAIELKDKTIQGKKKGKSSSFATVSMMYRKSLNNLMQTLNQTHPYFIRCIIPNELKKCDILDANLVLNQLKCNGVLEGIRIYQKGFPNRVSYKDFKHRYAILAAIESTIDDFKTAGEKMCESLVKSKKIKPDQFQCGLTKIFFRFGALAALEKYRDESLSAMITKFQQECRYFLAQRYYKQLQKKNAGLKIIQRNIRAWCTLWNWNWFKLLNTIQPLLIHQKKGEELGTLQQKCKDLEVNYVKEKKLRGDLELFASNLKTEKLHTERELVESEKHSAKNLAQKTNLENGLRNLKNRQTEQEDKKLETENEYLKKNVQDVDIVIEKEAKNLKIRTEQVNQELMDSLNAETNKLNKAKIKLEQTLNEADKSIERERRARQELDKQRRKAEGELKMAHDNLEELGRQQSEVENLLNKRNVELSAVSRRFEDEQILTSRLQRQIKELIIQIKDSAKELETEQQYRSKMEKSRNDAQIELEELVNRLNEAGGATQAQIELNKKREAEISKLRRELEDCVIQNEISSALLRKKQSDVVGELSDQLDAVHKSRTKLEKEKNILKKELEEAQNNFDLEAKQRQNIDRLFKQLETQLVETQLKSDDQSRQLLEIMESKTRLSSENSDLTRQLEDSESQVSALNCVKSQLCQQIEEFRQQLDHKMRERQTVTQQANNLQEESKHLREVLEEEREKKTEMQRLISKANSEAQQWRARYESEGIARAEESEEARRKIQMKAQQLQEQLDLANAKISSLEKIRHRFQQELEDAQLNAEQANTLVGAFGKKKKNFEKIIDEWQQKCENLNTELVASQCISRAAIAKNFEISSTFDELNETIEGLRRENKHIMQDLNDSSAQRIEDGKFLLEEQKNRKKIELELKELHQALEDAEAALEAEELKGLRAQVEVTQIRSEIEKQIAEKEEDLKNTRQNHQRAIESIEANLEVETKSRAELVKAKKKLENEIQNLEVVLDQTAKANNEAQRNAKQYHETICKLQKQIDEEKRVSNDANEKFLIMKRRVQIIQAENDKLNSSLEQVERLKRQTEIENTELKESFNELSNLNSLLTSAKRKLENDFEHKNSEINELQVALKNAKEHVMMTSTNAARLSEELRVEKEHSLTVERQRKSLDTQVKDLQNRFDEIDNLSLKGSKRTVAKLETKINDLESELECEIRRHSENQKNLRNKDRRIRELQFQVDEDKKVSVKMYELVEKLQGKLKIYKQQAEESEQLGALNLTKYRQLQQVVEDAEERADYAENSLSKLRVRSRSSTAMLGSNLFKGSFTSLLPSPSTTQLTINTSMTGSNTDVQNHSNGSLSETNVLIQNNKNKQDEPH